jgi:hypothetical protein
MSAMSAGTCKMMSYVEMLTALASVINLSAVSIERSSTLLVVSSDVPLLPSQQLALKGHLSPVRVSIERSSISYLRSALKGHSSLLISMKRSCNPSHKYFKVIQPLSLILKGHPTQSSVSEGHPTLS